MLGLAFLQAFWDGAPEKGYALCAPDALWRFQRSLHDPVEVPVRDAVRWLMDTLVAGFEPGTRYTVELLSVIGEGDEASFEYSATGQARGGKRYHNRYHVRVTTRNGRIVSIRPYFDTLYVHRTLLSLDGHGG
jgi:ketosteroid isomerase-like protein